MSYKKKDHVRKAQTEYTEKLDLAAYHDQSSDQKLGQFALQLPISNEMPDDYRRFVEIFLHMRT